MQTQPPEGTLTLAEAALFLKVHKATVRRWIEEGRLPAWQAKPGGVIRIDAREVRALLSRMQSEPEAAA
jgi:excisionase family DNA binding protein